jgi:hypothetical protein
VGHLGCFQSLAIVNSAAINMSVQVARLYPGAHLFQYMPRSGITGMYFRFIFSFLRNLCAAFHSGYTNLHSHQQCISVLFPPKASSPAFVVACVIYGGHSDRSEVGSPCCFNLHLLYGQVC